MDHLQDDGPNAGPVFIAQGNSPPLLNQPPRIFGSTSTDGSAMTAILPQAYFGEDDFAFFPDDFSDPAESKRRRTARACDMCRKKKIKCDGKLPACMQCLNYKTECVFTLVEKKRSLPKGAKYIEALENRSRRLEALLRLSGLVTEDDDGKIDLEVLEKRIVQKQASSSGSSPASKQVDGESPAANAEQPYSPPAAAESKLAAASLSASGRKDSSNKINGEAEKEKTASEKLEQDVEELSDMMCSLVTNSYGEAKYIGSSSGFSIFSPKGIQWVNEKTGDKAFQDMISSASMDLQKWPHWKPEVFVDVFNRCVYRPLPPKAETLSLLRDFFENFNCMFPLFHEPTFMHLVDKQYSQFPYDSSGWWASLNVTLAIAHRLRVMSNLVPKDEDDRAWGYLKNALAVFPELTLRNTDLLSVQALLGMSLFLQGTPNPQPSYVLTAAALRIAHSIGLHKRGTGFNLNAADREQRRRVFWIAYTVDRDLCLRSGRPPVQDDDDMNVELPGEDPPDNIGNIPLADGKGKINLFRLMCTFAIIQSKVYKQLYSVKASRQTDSELLYSIGELDKELEEWKDGIPLDFRPEHEIKASHSPLILNVVVLHFAYYNCLMTIHRMSIHHGYWTSRLSNFAIKGLNVRALNSRVFSSAALCVQAARASIDLLQYIPNGDSACVWMIIYYPVSALMTIFAYILQNPQDPKARADQQLMTVVTAFLDTLCQEEDNGNAGKMLNICSEFERVASVILNRAEKESSSRRKRKTQEVGDQQPEIFNALADPFTPSTNPTISERSHSIASSIASMTTSPAMPGTHYSRLGTKEGMQPPVTSLSSSSPQYSMLQSSNNAGSVQWAPPLRSNSTANSARTVTGLSDGIDTTSSIDGHDDTAFPEFRGVENMFQQPFAPQDLWPMPMTLAWDLADMTAYGGGGADVALSTFDTTGDNIRSADSKDSQSAAGAEPSTYPARVA